MEIPFYENLINFHGIFKINYILFPVSEISLYLKNNIKIVFNMNITKILIK